MQGCVFFGKRPYQLTVCRLSGWNKLLTWFACDVPTETDQTFTGQLDLNNFLTSFQIHDFGAASLFPVPFHFVWSKFSVTIFFFSWIEEGNSVKEGTRNTKANVGNNYQTELASKTAAQSSCFNASISSTSAFSSSCTTGEHTHSPGHWNRDEKCQTGRGTKFLQGEIGRKRQLYTR